MKFFKNTKSFIGDKIKAIFGIKKKVDQKLLDALEEILIESDVGINLANSFINFLQKTKFDQEVSNDEIIDILSNYIAKYLEISKTQIALNNRPHIIMMVGVNGSGKTTTIGKLAHKFQKEDKKVLIAACDTFRAAAVEQLEIIAHNVNASFVKLNTNSDPAAVAYKAMEQSCNFDVVLLDTAGRLHNNKTLMEELHKIKRVIKKIDPNVPHDIILTIDCVTGQSAINQVRLFNEIIGITGIIVTKLDGTAKGGMLVQIAKDFNIPIVGICNGEKIDNFHEFDPIIFSKSLLCF